MVEIYALLDPRDGAIRYIGKARNAQRRLKDHLRETRRQTPVYAWIGKLRSLGMTPGLRVIRTCGDDEWQEVERAEIAKARVSGERLLNVADGGDEPACPTEVRAENGRRNARAVHTDPKRRRIWDLKRRLGQAIREGYLSNRSRAKLREAARKCPDLFGAWLDLPDREENPDGTAVHLFGRTG